VVIVDMVVVDMIVVDVVEDVVVEVDSIDDHIYFDTYHRLDYGHQS